MRVESNVFVKMRGGYSGGSVRNGNYGPVYSKNVIPQQPNTNSQTWQKTNFKMVGEMWSNLTVKEKAEWVNYAAVKGNFFPLFPKKDTIYTGRQAFQSYRTLLAGVSDAFTKQAITQKTIGNTAGGPLTGVKPAAIQNAPPDVDYSAAVVGSDGNPLQIVGAAVKVTAANREVSVDLVASGGAPLIATTGRLTNDLRFGFNFYISNKVTSPGMKSMNRSNTRIATTGLLDTSGSINFGTLGWEADKDATTSLNYLRKGDFFLSVAVFDEFGRTSLIYSDLGEVE